MSTPGEHYFAADPHTPADRRILTVEIAGRRVGVATAAGVFCADRIDLGTGVLLRQVPPPPAQGNLLDLGCGWGPLALTMASLSPAATVWAVDVNRRALELMAENAAALDLGGIRAVTPTQVPASVGFEAIWSNPPIRIGKAALHELLLQWLPRLALGGCGYLVVQRNLGSDSLHTWLSGTLGRDFEVHRHASAKGFRVLSVQRLSHPDVAPA